MQYELLPMIPTQELQVLNNDFHKVIEFVQNFEFLPIIHALIYFSIGLLLTLIVRWFVGKIAERNVSQQHALLFRRITFYLGLLISIIYPLKTSGLDITALLGAAGILTFAIAFASQTTISNFLSGVFLEAEKPFVIGDYIQVNDVLGEVLSIDLLSVKIRTKDNTMVRISNETLLKTQFQNTTRFPIRRFDMKLTFSFQENLEHIYRILMEIAAKNSLCLVSPPPEISFQEFGESGAILQFSVWGKQSSYSQLQHSIQTEIQSTFKEKNIQFPAVFNTIIKN